MKQRVGIIVVALLVSGFGMRDFTPGISFDHYAFKELRSHGSFQNPLSDEELQLLGLQTTVFLSAQQFRNREGRLPRSALELKTSVYYPLPRTGIDNPIKRLPFYIYDNEEPADPAYAAGALAYLRTGTGDQETFIIKGYLPANGSRPTTVALKFWDFSFIAHKPEPWERQPPKTGPGRPPREESPLEKEYKRVRQMSENARRTYWQCSLLNYAAFYLASGSRPGLKDKPGGIRNEYDLYKVSKGFMDLRFENAFHGGFMRQADPKSPREGDFSIYLVKSAVPATGAPFDAVYIVCYGDGAKPVNPMLLNYLQQNLLN